MSHEMTENDSAVYFKKPAWHGLGNVVDNSLSVDDALEMSGLNWQVSKRALFTAGDITTPGTEAEDHRGILRTDINKIIGVVSPSYKLVQNSEVFNIAKSFGSEATVESAGSIQDGRKAYLLLHGDSFDVCGNHRDTVHRYMAMFWSHDGSAALNILPTSVRVVCKNTLDMVIGQAKGTSRKININHTGDVDSKISAATKAIERFKKTGEFFEEQVNHLANTNPGRQDITQFFINVYAKLNNVAIVMNNRSTEAEEENYVKCLTKVSKWTETFEVESQETYNWSYWTAANAITNDIQHTPGSRGRKRSQQSAAYNNLVGQNAVESRRVMDLALASVG